MSIIESNKLIAEFMGFEILGAGKYIYCDVYPGNYSIDSLPMLEFCFNNYNELMHVVERINDLNNIVEIHENNVRVVNTERSEVLVDVVAGSMFDAIYRAVVEFIVWYNEQKEK